MNYTSIEQSKKLSELGLSPESADMKYVPQGNYTNIKVRDFAVESNYVSPILSDEIPCWSVGALLEVMPSDIVIHDNLMLTHCHLNVTKSGVGYSSPFNGSCYNICWMENPKLIDALYNCVVWLLENNYIKKD